jgi:isoleucyl-tRNA synthetase
LAAQAVAAFGGDPLRAFLRGEALAVTVDGESHELGPDDLTIVRRAAGSLAVQEEGGFFVALDPTVTAELKREGHARELISRVQRMRKESGFAVSDRIVVRLGGGEQVREAVDAHGAWIAEELLATELVLVSDGDENGEDVHVIDLDGITAFVAITRVQ